MKRWFLIAVLCLSVLGCSEILNSSSDDTKDVELKQIIVDSINVIKPINSTHQIVITYNPTDTTQKGVQYISSNETILTVSADGLITTHTSGSATVTVKSTKNAEISTVIIVTVSGS